MKSLLCVAAIAALLGSGPAIAARFLTIEDYTTAIATLHKVNGVSEADRPAYMAAHKTELERATVIVTQASALWDTLDEANKQAVARYNHPFLCNLPVEEDTPDVTNDELLHRYVERMRRLWNVEPGTPKDKKIQMTPLHLALMDAMMEHYACSPN